MEQNYYRPAATALRLGVSTSTLQKWRSNGTGPDFIRVGSRRVVYAETALDAYLTTRVNAAEG